GRAQRVVRAGACGGVADGHHPRGRTQAGHRLPAGGRRDEAGGKGSVARRALHEQVRAMNDRAFRDRLVVTVAVLIAWQLAAVAFGAHWISPPLATARRVLELALNGELARHALYTLAAAAGGFILGGVPGGILPFVLRRAPRLAAVLDPYLVAAYGMPKLALAPLFILWFGIGLASKVTLVASIVFFLVFFSAAAGVRATDVRLVAMARVVGASERALARRCSRSATSRSTCGTASCSRSSARRARANRRC